MQKPIHKYSLGHMLLRSYVDIYLYSFYKEVTVIGKDNVPKNKPVILAINHQNTLMDALTVLCTLKGQPVFMARADIFKSPIAAKILRFFKILPIYRIRDGVDSLKNNDAVFEQAVATLENSKRLAILPEGSHLGQRRLRVLKKGLARIAFQAEERNNFNLDLQIIPVALDYSNYINFGSNLLVKFGKPINVSEFKDTYLQNKQKGMNELMHYLRNKMVDNMLHIGDSENYDKIEAVKDICINNLESKKGAFANHSERIDKSQQIVDNLIELNTINANNFFDLAEKATYIKENVKDLKLRLWTIRKSKYSLISNSLNYIMLIILFPVFLLGFVPNILPFYLPVYLARKVKDPQFLSSFRFVLALIVFTLTYLIYLVVLLIFVKPFYLALAIFISIPILGKFSYNYYKYFKKTIAKSRVNKLNRNNNIVWNTIQAYNQEIIDRFN